MNSDLSMAGLSPVARLNKRQKAAIVVRLLRSEGVDLSLQDLPDDLQVGLTREMGNLRSVSRDTLRAVVDEFVEEMEGFGLSFSGGLRGALTFLDGALSPAAVDRLKAEAGGDVVTDAWARLNGLESERLVPMIEAESVEIGAVILSKLAVPKAADILGQLPGEAARRLAYAMGQTTVSPETVTRIGAALVARLDAEPKSAFGGEPVDRVGAILNVSAAVTRDDVLDGLDRQDKPFADKVRAVIFTFADIPNRLEPADVPKVIREVDPPVLTAALKTALTDEKTAPAVEFILSNMSQRMAQQLRDEIETMGRVKDGEAATGAVVQAIRDMEESGAIMLLSGDAADV